MGRFELSQVQVANLNMLILIADYVKRDTAIACSRFGLDADQAGFLSTLSVPEILTLVVHLGDECLFPPRADLVQVLSWPPELAGAMLMVHPGRASRPVRQPETAARTSVAASGIPDN